MNHYLEIQRLLDLHKEAYLASNGRMHGWITDLARKVGIHPTYIGKLDKGERRSVGQETLRRMAAVIEGGETFGVDGVDEVQVMGRVAELLSPLDDAARVRVAAWVGARWGQE